VKRIKKERKQKERLQISSIHDQYDDSKKSCKRDLLRNQKTTKTLREVTDSPTLHTCINQLFLCAAREKPKELEVE